MGKPIDDETIQEMIKIYTTENISITQLTKRCGIKSRSVIAKYLEMNGIHVKSPHELVFTDDVIKQVIELYQNGKTLEEISKQLNICENTVSKILHDNNIKLRSPSDFTLYSIDETYFEILDTPNKCYVLGYLYSDGTVHKKSYTLHLTLQERDKEILEKIREDMKYTGPLLYKDLQEYNKKIGKHSQNVWSLVIARKKIGQDLIRLGVVPNKTFVLKYPNFLTEDQHSHFLRGYIDGDGCISKYNGHCCNVSFLGTYDFCYGAKEIIESILDIHCCIRPDKNIYKILINGKNQVKKFLNWIYKDAELYLTRKYERYCQYYKDDNNEVA